MIKSKTLSRYRQTINLLKNQQLWIYVSIMVFVRNMRVQCILMSFGEKKCWWKYILVYDRSHIDWKRCFICLKLSITWYVCDWYKFIMQVFRKRLTTGADVYERADVGYSHVVSKSWKITNIQFVRAHNPTTLMKTIFLCCWNWHRVIHATIKMVNWTKETFKVKKNKQIDCVAKSKHFLLASTERRLIRNQTCNSFVFHFCFLWLDHNFPVYFVQCWHNVLGII